MQSATLCALLLLLGAAEVVGTANTRRLAATPATTYCRITIRDTKARMGAVSCGAAVTGCPPAGSAAAASGNERCRPGLMQSTAAQRCARLLLQWYSDPCAKPDDSAPLASNTEIEYYGIKTAPCGGESYAIARMFLAGTDSSGQATTWESIGYVPSSDLGFCTGKSDCGATACGTAAGVELTNSCFEDGDCCSCQCTAIAEFARRQGRTDNPTQLTLVDGSGGERIFTWDPAIAAAAGASPSVVIADKICTDFAADTPACPSKVYIRDFAATCPACPEVCEQSAVRLMVPLTVRGCRRRVGGRTCVQLPGIGGKMVGRAQHACPRVLGRS